MKVTEKKNLALSYRKRAGFSLFLLFVTLFVISFVVTMTALVTLSGLVAAFSFLNTTLSTVFSIILAFFFTLSIVSLISNNSKMVYAVATGDEPEEMVKDKITNLDKAIREIAPTPVQLPKVNKKGTVVMPDGQDSQSATKPTAKPADHRPTLSCLSFKFINKNTEIEATIKSFQLERIVIPAVHNGFPVRVIKSAIEDPEVPVNTNSVFLPKSIRQIFPYTFANLENLMDIQLPDGLTKIGSGAFEGCSKLSEIFIPGSVTEIGQNAFHDCGFLTISIESDYKPTQWDIQYKDSETPVIYSAIRK